MAPEASISMLFIGNFRCGRLSVRTMLYIVQIVVFVGVGGWIASVQDADASRLAAGLFAVVAAYGVTWAWSTGRDGLIAACRFLRSLKRARQALPPVRYSDSPSRAVVRLPSRPGT